MRSPTSSLAPSKFDITAGGHYSAGEELFDGLREVREELGREYSNKQVTYIGRRLNVSPDINGNMRNNIVDISLILDNTPIQDYTLEKQEVYGVCACPVDKLIQAHGDNSFSFDVILYTGDGKTETIKVSQDAFPYNWDNYHYKVALLVKRFLEEDKTILY